MVKKKLQAGQHACIAWNHSGSSYMSEIIANAGFDGAIIDLEHGPWSLESTATHCQAVGATNCTPMARIPDENPATIKRVLDSGIQGLLIPQISNVKQAKEAVLASKYPPLGFRGVAASTRAAGFGNNSQEYFQNANDEIFIALMIENVSGFQNLDDILNVEHYDAIFIGPTDLASSLGYLGNPDEEEVKQVITKIEKKVIASDKYLGSIATNDQQINEKLSKGYNFLMMMSDVMFLCKEAMRIIQNFGN